MSVIRSASYQWKKSEYSNQLQAFFRQEPKLNELFIGATNSETICNLISALIILPEKNKGETYEIEFEQAFDALFQCFTLLFIKEVEHENLSQAEQLVQSITLYYAKKVNQNHDNYSSFTVNKAQKTTIALKALEEQRKQLRKENLNMRSS